MHYVHIQTPQELNTSTHTNHNYYMNIQTHMFNKKTQMKKHVNRTKNDAPNTMSNTTLIQTVKQTSTHTITNTYENTYPIYKHKHAL